MPSETFVSKLEDCGHLTESYFFSTGVFDPECRVYTKLKIGGSVSLVEQKRQSRVASCRRNLWRRSRRSSNSPSIFIEFTLLIAAFVQFRIGCSPWSGSGSIPLSTISIDYMSRDSSWHAVARAEGQTSRFCRPLNQNTNCQQFCGTDP